jgi:hypothetical protein
MERAEKRQEDAAPSGPDTAAEASPQGLIERARAGDPAALRALKRRQAARRDRESGAGAEVSATHIEGEPIVLERNGDNDYKDVEAEAARAKLRLKVQRTQEAIEKGARDALLYQLGAQGEEKQDAVAEKSIDVVRDPLKEKLSEFVKGRAFQKAKVKGGDAAARQMKNRLASEASHIAGKAVAIGAAVGMAKDVVDAVGEAEIADFTASTWRGLMKELDTNVPPAFDAYRAQVDGMDAQSAIDAAEGETTEPWVPAAHVKEQLIRVFNAAMIQASATGDGPLKGGQLFDRVQDVLHHKDGAE